AFASSRVVTTTSVTTTAGGTGCPRSWRRHVGETVLPGGLLFGGQGKNCFGFLASRHHNLCHHHRRRPVVARQAARQLVLLRWPHPPQQIEVFLRHGPITSRIR